MSRSGADTNSGERKQILTQNPYFTASGLLTKHHPEYKAHRKFLDEFFNAISDIFVPVVPVISAINNIPVGKRKKDFINYPYSEGGHTLLMSTCAHKSIYDRSEDPNHDVSISKIAETLIRNGANVDAKDRMGNTAVVCAIIGRQFPAANTLINGVNCNGTLVKCDVNSVNINNETVLDIAKEVMAEPVRTGLLRRLAPQDRRFVDLLISKGAKTFAELSKMQQPAASAASVSGRHSPSPSITRSVYRREHSESRGVSF